MIDDVLSEDTASEIELHLKPHIIENSVLCSDGAWAYVNIAKTTNCDHKRLISGKNRVIDKIYHIQTANGRVKVTQILIAQQLLPVRHRAFFKTLDSVHPETAKLDTR